MDLSGLALKRVRKENETQNGTAPLREAHLPWHKPALELGAYPS